MADPIDYATRGLTAGEVAQRQAEGRVNTVVNASSRSLWQIIKANVFTRFNALLGSLFVLVVFTGSLIDGLFGIGLVVNALLGIGQEWYAKRKLDSLSVLHTPRATVIRDGEVCTVDICAVVEGDLVCLSPGDQVPADGPLMAVDNLEIDESNLTGESDAVAKVAGDPVFSGTAVVAGSGCFRAAIVGEAATANKLAKQARVFTRAFSDVQASTNRLLKIITWVLVAMFPVALIAQYRSLEFGTWAEIQTNWRYLALRTTAGLVALVPEGLVVLTTLAFLLAAVQLARQQALVQELPAVEGLARVDVICLDKTGTLTHGEITYDGFELVTGCDRGTVLLARSSAEECAKRTVPLSHQHAQVEDILGAFAHDPNPNATAQAIARAIGPSQQEVVARVPFSSARKYSALTFADGQAWVFGAPEIIAGDDRALMERTNELAAAGVRTVVLAKVADLVDWGEVTPIALVELTEQIRDDAAETIAYFASQDVAVKVISGDNPITVAAVARRVGLLTEGGDGGHHEDVTRGRGCCHASCDNTPGPLSHLSLSTVVDARDLPDTVEELTKIVDGIIVFGRVTPEKKQLIVRALQACGHTVAMTGDGVNDILALKDADVGVAMGNGASATKAVAQIVLLDSRFSHMPQVLAEGRRLIGNVERVASLFVTKNVMAAALIISTAIIGVGFPFIPRQMTLLSTLTIGIPAFLLALGPNKRKYVPGFLGRVLALSVPAGIAAGLATFIAFSFGLGSDPQRSTLALVVLFAVNFWLLFVLSRPVATWKLLTIAGVVGLAVLAFTLRVTRDFLQLDLPTGQWPLAIGLGIAGATCVELAHRLRRARSWSNPFRRRVDVHRAEP